MVSQVGHNVRGTFTIMHASVKISMLSILYEYVIVFTIVLLPILHDHLPNTMFVLNTTAYNSIQINNGIGISDLEAREVCSDISYATFYEGHLPRYGHYGIW